MNKTLELLAAIADQQEVAELVTRVEFEILGTDPDATPICRGHYCPDRPRERQAFAQAVGKLLNAGYVVTTWRAA